MLIFPTLPVLLLNRYAFGGQLDEEELQLEVADAIAKKQAKGSKLQQAKRALRSVNANK